MPLGIELFERETAAPVEPSERDASVVARIRAAGGVVIGKTNQHEFAYGVTSENPWFGSVRHPQDAARIVGGSSGGSAVAVATGVCDWALGTDTGGSIRIPASLCGVFGLKTSRGLLPMDGVRALAPTMDTVGPLARNLADLSAALRVLDPGGRATALTGEPMLATLAGWTDDLSPDIAPLWAKAGADLAELEFRPLPEVSSVARTVLLAEATRHVTPSPLKLRDPASRELAAILADGRTLLGGAYERALGRRAELIDEFSELLTGVDALVLPTTATRAPLRGSASGRAALTQFTRLSNLLGVPALSIPVPTDGLPFGVQLIGRAGQDHQLIEIAGEYLRRR
jgi:aspartyl-tRNA(Asn)/glutamyl-tRNA(Gln) amidotransferase subunit A